MPHVITTSIEHASILEPLRELENQKHITLTVVPVTSEGIVEIKSIREALTSETVLVSVIHVNNEIGTIQPVREIGRKFNNTFGETFPVEPQDLVIESVATVPGTDGQKMSKSYKNTIPLFGTDEEIKKAVMSIVTDSSGDTPVHVYAIHKLFRSEAELAALYEEKKGKYKDLKEALLADILAFVTPMRERRAHYEAHPEIVADILKKGGEKARAKAQAKMQLVRERVGLV
jgi:tryptophanyl-tRNA synthetase